MIHFIKNWNEREVKILGDIFKLWNDGELTLLADVFGFWIASVDELKLIITARERVE